MRKKHSRVVEAILETAEDLHRAGLMSDEEYRRFRARRGAEKTRPSIAPKRKRHSPEGAHRKHPRGVQGK